MAGRFILHRIAGKLATLHRTLGGDTLLLMGATCPYCHGVNENAADTPDVVACTHCEARFGVHAQSRPAEAPKPPPAVVLPLAKVLPRPSRAPTHGEPLQPIPSFSNSRFCFRCGVLIFEDAAICPRCGVVQPGFMEPLAQPALGYVQKDSGIAALLSFFCPGAGQMYARNVVRGILILIVWFLSIPLTYPLFCIPTVAFHIWQVFDASACAVRLNRKRTPRRIAYFD